MKFIWMKFGSVLILSQGLKRNGNNCLILDRIYKSICFTFLTFVSCWIYAFRSALCLLKWLSKSSQSHIYRYGTIIGRRFWLKSGAYPNNALCISICSICRSSKSYIHKMLSCEPYPIPMNLWLTYIYIYIYQSFEGN